MSAPPMQSWRLTINRDTGQATVERLEPERYWRPWVFMGVLESEQKAEEMIRAGWPDSDGIPTTTKGEPFTLEVIR